LTDAEHAPQQIASSRASLLVDADSHVLEPPDVWQRHIEPRFRERAVRVVRSDAGHDVLLVDGQPARLTTPEMLGDFGGMGRTLDEQASAALSGRYADNAPAAATDPDARVAQLDREGVEATVLYPSLGLQWPAETPDPAYVHANLVAYNRWLEDFCAGSRGRLVPVAHLVLGEAHVAAKELRRAVANGARGGFLLPYTHDGKPHGHPDHDPLFAASCDLGVPLGIHTGVDPAMRDLYRRYDGLTWPDAIPAGIWFLQLMFSQAVQQAFSTFFLHGTFDRFPDLRLVVLEAGAGWIGFWMDRMDAMFAGALRLTMPLRDLPSSYVRRQVWISADPDERALAAIVPYVGADRFVWASDYPHSDHTGGYLDHVHALARLLPDEPSRRALLGGNAAALYGIPAPR
jgi:predicted TIM-barrel fold metal-dependent hydrolase